MGQEKYELSGKVYKIGEPKTFKGDYRKQEVFIETKREWNGKEFSDIIKIVADNNRVDSVSMLSIGDEVSVGFTLGGRMWSPPDDDKEINFTELKAIWISKSNAQPVTPQQPEQTASQTVNDVTDNSDTFDGLPF